MCIKSYLLVEIVAYSMPAGKNKAKKYEILPDTKSENIMCVISLPLRVLWCGESIANKVKKTFLFNVTLKSPHCTKAWHTHTHTSPKAAELCFSLQPPLPQQQRENTESTNLMLVSVANPWRI